MLGSFSERTVSCELLGSEYFIDVVLFVPSKEWDIKFDTAHVKTYDAQLLIVLRDDEWTLRARN